MDETPTMRTPVLIATGLANGLKTISGSPEVSGFTDSLDLALFDSIRIVFTSSFSVFPPQHFEDPYTALVRMRGSADNILYFVWPHQATQTHEITVQVSELIDPENASFEFRASSNAPTESVLVTISDVAVHGWAL